MRGIVSGLVLAACLAACGPALAQGLDLVIGPSVTSSGRTTGAAFASVFGDRPADDRAHFEPIGTIGWVAPRATDADDLHHGVFLAAAGVRIVAANHHWFVGEQLAVTSRRTDALSSRFEFMTSGGWQNGHFIVMLRHVSNANVLGGGENLGETMLLAGLRW